jgi:hypothetical protein
VLGKEAGEKIWGGNERMFNKKGGSGWFGRKSRRSSRNSCVYSDKWRNVFNRRGAYYDIGLKITLDVVRRIMPNGQSLGYAEDEGPF